MSSQIVRMLDGVFPSVVTWGEPHYDIGMVGVRVDGSCLDSSSATAGIPDGHDRPAIEMSIVDGELITRDLEKLNGRRPIHSIH